MIIKEIQLTNFRNYNRIRIAWNDKINIIIGNNAQGKSNILEAINLIGTGKSHRTNKDSELINWYSDQAYIKALLDNRHLNLEMEVILRDGKKEFIVNKNKLSKNSQLAQFFHTVLFSPEDLMLIKGGPRERRNFLDSEISQVSPRYGNTLSNYKRVLLQRNNNLKKQLFGGQLQVWTRQLIDFGSYIVKKRLETVEKLKPLSRLICRKITNGTENMELNYLSSIKNISYNSSIEIIKEMYSATLSEKKEEEYNMGVTLVGPHRDDMLISINDIEIRSFGSQGQQRTASLALKLSELEFIKSETGEYPVLLLDDVFSELDNNRKKYLVTTVLKKIQTFITGTEINDIVKTLTEKAAIYKVENGNINNFSREE